MRRLAVLGGLLAAAADGVYAYAIWQQNTSDGTLRVPFVAAFIGVCAAAAIVSALVPLRGPRVVLLSFSVVGLLVLGFLAIGSVGLLLWVALVPIALAWVRAMLTPLPRILAAVSGSVLALVLIVAGFWLTQFPVQCPSSGYSSGSGSGFLTGDYSWTCSGGKLTTGQGS